MSTQTARGHKATVTDSSPRLSTDDLHHLLSNHRRRTILEALHADGPLPKGELAERLAARETGKPIEAVDYRERKRALVSIYQNHAPALVDHGAIRETPDGYALGPTADALLPYCDGVQTGWFSAALRRFVR